ncbi:MAG: hypothetical protein QOI31_1752 [Solirubrobacterales bacterium]|nr:hypothetical protein [Solirubrobacterales bacterium]
MTDDRSWTFAYAGLPDEGAIEPPQIWIDLRGPKRQWEYPCLLDSGASFSALPLEAADELGIDQELLEPTEIRTALGRRRVLHLRRSDLISACWSDQTIPISPFFMPPEIIEDERFETDAYILGRDFFLSVEVTFRQAAAEVILRPI